MFRLIHVRFWMCHQVGSLYQDIWVQRTSRELYDSHWHEKNLKKICRKEIDAMQIYYIADSSKMKFHSYQTEKDKNLRRRTMAPKTLPVQGKESPI